MEIEPNLSLLPKKKRMKILNHKERKTKKAKFKAEKEAQKAKDKLEKEAKKAERSDKSKAVVASTPILELLKASIGCHRILTSRIPPLHSSQFQDCNSVHHQPSRTMQWGLCFWMSFSSLHP